MIRTESYTVAEILEKIDSFGIPHFQRGVVWNLDNQSRLLESFYFKTPCGSILLWRPSNPDEFGTKLNSNSTSPFQFLIIDGQQRIRTILDIFGNNTFDDENDEDNGNQGLESSKKKTWCLNLYHIKEIAQNLKQGKDLSEKPMFLFTADPSLKETVKRSNLLKIGLILNMNWEPLPEAEIEKNLRSPKLLINPKDHFDKNDIVDKLLGLKLELKLAAMKQRVFPFYIYEIDDLTEVVNIYNRINSAGIRVESEEKTFATLASIYPGINKWIKDLFDAIHPDESNGNNDRYFLKRKQEKMFGFKFFIRTIVQVCSYHFNMSVGSSGFSFYVLHSDNNKKKIKSKPEEFERLLKQAANIVLQIYDIICNKLYIDDLRFLPDTFQLLPVIQFMTIYYEEDKTKRERSFNVYRNKLALITLKLLMYPDQTRGTILPMCNNINQNIFHDLNKALLSFEKEIDKTIGTETEKHIEKYINKANSLNHRYTLLLYGLERLGKAKDFSIKNISHEKDETAEYLSKALACQRQHLVPYALLKNLSTTEKKVGRENKHVFNNIGNISYISKKLNWDIGERVLDLQLEDDNNLSAHFLNDKLLRQKYEKFSELNVLKDEDRKKAIKTNKEDLYKAFENFSVRRKMLLIKAFYNWLNTLGEESIINKNYRVEPLGRFFSEPDIEKYIHQFDSDILDEYVEDTLVDQMIMLKEKGINKEPQNNGIKIITKKEKSKTQFVLLNLNPKRIKFDFSKDETKKDEIILEQYADYAVFYKNRVLRIPLEEENLHKVREIIQNIFACIMTFPQSGN